VTESTGIPAANVVVAATHSHTAPHYYRSLYLHLDGKESIPERAKYVEKLIAGTADAIAKAHSKAAPVSLSAGKATQETPVAFCRRFVMRDGSVRTWANYQNPDVLRAAAPIDPKVTLLKIASPDGKELRGVVSNFALHLDTVGGLQWSADYPFFIEKKIRAARRADAVSIFTAGCCGDINHVNPRSKKRNKTDFIGGSLGETIDSHLGKLTKLEQASLRVRSTRVKLPLQDSAPGDLDRAVELLEKVAKKEKIDFYDHVWAKNRILIDNYRNGSPTVPAEKYASWGLSRAWSKIGDALPVEVHAICLGRDLAIVCLPGEVFVELGLQIQQGSPFRTTIVVELANAAETQYIPTRGAYAQGGYEVTNTTLKPGGGEMLVEAALGLLRDIASSQD